jgi:hypothetical protein
MVARVAVWSLLLLTSNRPVEDWGKLLGDSAAVTGMLDRLLHHGHALKCGPRSWRTKTLLRSGAPASTSRLMCSKNSSIPLGDCTHKTLPALSVRFWKRCGRAFGNNAPLY